MSQFNYCNKSLVFGFILLSLFNFSYAGWEIAEDNPYMALTDIWIEDNYSGFGIWHDPDDDCRPVLAFGITDLNPEITDVILEEVLFSIDDKQPEKMTFWAPYTENDSTRVYYSDSLPHDKKYIVKDIKNGNEIAVLLLHNPTAQTDRLSLTGAKPMIEQAKKNCLEDN